MSVSCKSSALQQSMLFYFNRLLLQKRVISESEYRSMNIKIQNRSIRIKN